MGKPSWAEIAALLRSAKRAVEEFGLLIADRGKNNQVRVELGLTVQNLEDIVFGLTVEDYHSGPEPDRDRGGEVWVFGPAHDGGQLYIKLKLLVDGPITRVKCISFHLAERELRLPYRKGGEE